MPGIPANTAKPNERKLNFWERIYLPEALKGLGYSFRKMTKEPMYTFQYPEEQWYPPDNYRGRPVLVEEEGRPPSAFGTGWTFSRHSATRNRGSTGISFPKTTPTVSATAVF